MKSGWKAAGQRETSGWEKGRNGRRSLTAQQLVESGGHLRFREELLRLGRGGLGGVGCVALEQLLGGFGEQLRRGLTGEQGDKFQARGLLIIESDVHKVNGMLSAPMAVN